MLRRAAPALRAATGRRLRPGRSGAPSARLVALFVLPCLVSLGCALTADQAIRYHAFDYRAPTKENTEVIPETIIVYRFMLHPTVESHSLTVSDSQGKEQPVAYHAWEENPADMITNLIKRDLDRSGLFKRVVGHWSTARYRYALEGKVMDLGIVKHGEQRTALLAAEIVVTDIAKQLNIVERSYKIEAPCPDESPETMVRAINRAVKELSGRVRADIRAAIEKKDIPTTASPSSA